MDRRRFSRSTSILCVYVRVGLSNLGFLLLREKLDKAYDKLKFKRQEEAALVMDLQQVRPWVMTGLGLWTCSRSGLGS